MDEWITHTLGQLADIQTGPFGSQLHASDYVDFGIPSIMPKNIGQQLDINLESIAFISEADAQRLEKYRVKQNDIVFSRRGDVEKCAFITEDMEGWLCGTGCIKISFFPNVNVFPKFLAYYFSTRESKYWLTSHAVGTTMPNLNSTILGNFPVELPPLEEQKAITAILSSLDDKIDLLHRQNKTLEALAQTLFRHCFIDNAEEDWKEVTLGEVLSELEVGTRPKGGIGNVTSGIPSIGAESIVRIGVFDFYKTKYIPQDFYEKMTRGKIQNKDVLVYKDGGTPGSFEPHISMVGDGFPFEVCTINSHVYRVRTNGTISQIFLYFWFSSESTLEEMRKRSTGIAIPGINKSAIQSLPLTLPSSLMLNEFDSIVEPFVTKIFANCNQIRTLEKLRDTLLPKLMSGEVRVSNVPSSSNIEDVLGLFERMGVVETPHLVPVPMDSIILAEEKATYQTGLSDAGLCFLETLHQLEQTSSAPTVGKTIAQKTGYVLKDVGVEMASEFVRGNNGPFSADFAETLKSLQSAGFLRQQPHRRRPIIVVHTEPQYAAQREQFASRLASFKPMIDKTLALVKCFKNKNHAEYVGTVLFVARELEKERGFVAREDIVSQVTEWKPHWFTENRTRRINEAIDFLVEMGFVELLRAKQ